MTVLYHYTSNKAFLSIISTHKIRASEFTLSNDTLEGKWIREAVEQYCVTNEVPFDIANAIIQEVAKLISVFGAAGICLSEEGDLLSQWRAYSNNGSGVSVGFEKSCFGVTESPLPSLDPVVYDLDVQKKRLQEKMDRAIELGKKGAVGSVVRSLLGTAGLTEEQIEANKRLDREFMEQILALLPLCYIFKNPAFQEEKEWRSVNIVFSPVFSSVFDSKDYSEWHLEHMDFRALPDRIVPYKEFSLDTKLDRPAIREVVLGPRNVTPVQVVEAALKRHGWKGVDVRKSTASYR